jgi:hypothetical protein
VRSCALILLIALTAGRPALAAEPTRPTGPPVSHFQGQCDSDPDGAKFAARACYTKFDPAQLFNPSNTRYARSAEYQAPTCDNSQPVTDRQREVLAKAYGLAPGYMKAKLCRLTKIFVIKSGSLSPTMGHGGWGFWETPPRTGTFIAISDRTLEGTVSLDDHEHEIWRRLLHLKKQPDPKALPRLVDANSSDGAQAALGVLAHEMGHILLADTNADGVDPRHPRRLVSGPPSSACFEHAFIEQSWNRGLFHANMRRWVVFGDQNDNVHKDRKIDFVLAKLRRVVHNAISRAVVAIRRIEHSGEFVSPFAAVSPEEDFVETYKYKVLADAAPSLAIKSSTKRGEVALRDRLATGVLAKKVACLGDLGLLSGEP